MDIPYNTSFVCSIMSIGLGRGELHDTFNVLKISSQKECKGKDQ